MFTIFYSFFMMKGNSFSEHITGTKMSSFFPITMYMYVTYYMHTSITKQDKRCTYTQVCERRKTILMIIIKIYKKNVFLNSNLYLYVYYCHYM